EPTAGYQIVNLRLRVIPIVSLRLRVIPVVVVRACPVGVQSRSRYRQRLACTAPAVRELHNTPLRRARRRKPSSVKRATSDLGRRQVGNTIRGKLPAGDLARRQIPDAFWRQLPGDNILRRVLV